MNKITTEKNHKNSMNRKNHKNLTSKLLTQYEKKLTSKLQQKKIIKI